ncbi:MAG: lipid hydroperoxide peroxidase [Bacteroidetes bacterium GWE2_41_25]|nr:MAG: lipid hydroperoxide peroxidase [Bacteroidetes bacterium GWA2_40_15]OFX91912.1 MAG: lipid hydroperoxide peroxidase [Bacteroidetes bacterium GWC2_40_22]OFY10756.1 MAG: lipid hydroperoxide peroxidase [Bacteroidetes bacterium GWE2_41_25]OFY58534.1 MAG: lipid hydroperoxide peroxidase [Bacteroidetes bacterium GWF2_41_9]HAM10426.1 thiol peroxidase [Bacteroidales bacterium]
MAKLTLKGAPVTISGNLPAIGSKAPDFKLVKSDLSYLKLSELKGKKVVLSIFPSQETGTCSASIRRFNRIAGGKKDVMVLGISKDLPFAHKRFCDSEGITNVVTLSGYRDQEFGKLYGVDVLDGVFGGLYARSVIIINETGEVVYTQLVSEMANEPDYDAALEAL